MAVPAPPPRRGPAGAAGEGLRGVPRAGSAGEPGLGFGVSPRLLPKARQYFDIRNGGKGGFVSQSSPLVSDTYRISPFFCELVWVLFF